MFLKEEPRSWDDKGGDPEMLISRQIQREMTKWFFLEKPRYACKNQVPEPFLMDTPNRDMDHTKPVEGLGGLEMELKGKLFKFSLPFPTLI